MLGDLYRSRALTLGRRINEDDGRCTWSGHESQHAGPVSIQPYVVGQRLAHGGAGQPSASHTIADGSDRLPDAKTLVRHRRHERGQRNLLARLRLDFPQVEQQRLSGRTKLHESLHRLVYEMKRPD